MKDNSIPAFPYCFEDTQHHPNWRQSGGMSLRDYFAAKAMQGILAGWPVTAESTFNPPAVAARAFVMADAMLKARDK